MAEYIAEVEEPERVEPAPVVEQRSLILPVCLVLAALTIYFGFQTFHLLSERSNLRLVKASQDAAIAEAQKVQSQFKTLVTRISGLAEKGHAGAKMVMEELFQRGVSAAPEMAPQTQAPAKPETKPAK